MMLVQYKGSNEHAGWMTLCALAGLVVTRLAHLLFDAVGNAEQDRLVVRKDLSQHHEGTLEVLCLRSCCLSRRAYAVTMYFKSRHAAAFMS